MKRIIGRVLQHALFLALVLALVAAGLGFLLHHNRMIKQRSYFSQHQEVLETAYHASVQMYRLAMEGFYNNAICQPEVLRLFSEGINGHGDQRAIAKGRLYRRLFPQYQAMKRQNLLQLHFHLADGTSYLRFHKPDRHGDNLLQVRRTVRIANSRLRPIDGFETGKVRSGFRYVYPVFWEGHHLGSVEASVTTKAIRDAMAELDPRREYSFVMNRLLIEPFVFSEQKWLYSTSDLHPKFIVEDANALLPDSPPPLSDHAKAVTQKLRKNKNVQDAMDRGEAITIGSSVAGLPYVVSLLPIFDVADQLAGYLVTYAPDRVTGTYRKEYIVFLVAAASALAMIGTLLLAYRRRSLALSREKHNLKVMNDALAEGVYVMDKEGAIIRINPAALRILGYDEKELIGKNAHAQLHSHPNNAHLQLAHCPLYRQASRGIPYDGEEQFLHKTGKVLIVELASRPITVRGELVGSIMAFHDITERKRMEAALGEKEQIQRTLMESLPVGLIIINAKTRVIEWINSTAAHLFGAPADAIAGNRCHRFMCPADENTCPILDLNQRVDSSDRILCCHDGSRIPVLKTVNRIVIRGDEKLLECIIDIRSRVAAEKALIQANDKLTVAIAHAEELAGKAEAANRSKSVFLANMSHEIRTPLNAILGHSQLLQQDLSLNSEQRRQLMTINRSGDHLLKLISDILEMSKIEAGHIKVQPEAMNFQRLIDDIYAIFQLACQKKDLHFTIDTVGQIPGPIIADPGKIRQILINLVSNAVKFTGQGGRITLGVRATEERNRTWAITMDVRDTGSGIGPAEQANLFHAFEQTTSGHRASEGTGLGLSISRAYARSMGGDLRLVASDVDQGAVFRFTFLAKKADRPEDEANVPITRQWDTASTPRVLIVEDDAVCANLLKRVLDRNGFETLVVESGENALTAMETFSPKVVLMDVLLPGMDGYETIRRIRRRPGGPEAYIITVTATGINADEIRQKAKAAGADDFVPKPFKTEDIVDKIRGFFMEDEDFDLSDSCDGENTDPPAVMEKVCQLSKALRQRLQNAVESGDMTQFTKLADEATAIDRQLADHLKNLALQFDYAALLNILSTHDRNDATGEI